MSVIARLPGPGTRQEAIQLANAAGRDAGNRHAKRAGRTAWSLEDLAIAADTCRRVLEATSFGSPPQAT